MYYEGYMHAVGVAVDPLMSLNPRSCCMDMKSPAPLRTAAFIEAFRRVNSGALAAVAAGLPATGVCGPLVKRIFRDHKLFADLAVQVWHVFVSFFGCGPLSTPTSPGFSLRLLLVLHVCAWCGRLCPGLVQVHFGHATDESDVVWHVDNMSR